MSEAGKSYWVGERGPELMTGGGQEGLGTQTDHAPANPLDRDHARVDAHSRAVPVEPSGGGQATDGNPHGSTAPANPLVPDHTYSGAQHTHVGDDLSGGGQIPYRTQTPFAPASVPGWAEGDSLLLIFADTLSDLEDVRIRFENRARALEQGKGGGPSLKGTPAWQLLTSLAEQIRTIEHGTELNLKRAIREHPLGPWIKATTGVGEKQGARLLAALGDPYWNTLHKRPRTVSELWAYCGLHVLHPGRRGFDAHASGAGVDPSSDAGQRQCGDHPDSAGIAPSRSRGQKANWSGTAKMRAFLVAESCIKARTSPYRSVYEAGREKYADATHAHPCPRCGPKGAPAEPGSPLSLGHQHARAIRLVMKAILRDLWLEARRLHEGGASA